MTIKLRLVDFTTFYVNKTNPLFVFLEVTQTVVLLTHTHSGSP